MASQHSHDPLTQVQDAPAHVVKRTVGTDGASLLEVSLLADNRGDTTGTQSSGTSTDQLGQVSEKGPLFQSGLETEKVGKDSDHGQ